MRLRALTSWVVYFLTLPHFECALEPSTILGSVFSNPASFRVCLRALTSWVVYFLTLPPFECALEPSTTLGSVFYNPTSFQVRLWALTSQVVRFLTLPPFECAFQPSFPFESYLFLNAPLSFHLLNSALWTLSCRLFKTFYFTWVGHLSQSDFFENSFHLLSRLVAHYNETTLRNPCISHHL